MNKEEIILTASKITKLKDQIKGVDAEIKALETFDGVGHLGVGLMGSSIGHISFGQLLERYEDVLLRPLVQLKKQERRKVEEELDGVLAKLFSLVEPTESLTFNQEPAVWYPDTPGWTWYEHKPTRINDYPVTLAAGEVVLVLTAPERDRQSWTEGALPVEDWCWDTIVAYATED